MDTTHTTLAEVLKAHEGLDPTAVLLDERTAAACVEQSPKTLESWRRNGSELPFLKIGRLVRYRLSDVLKLLDARTFTTSREAMTRDRGIPTPKRGRRAAA